MPLNFTELETVYEDLALALDTIAAPDREVFLSKIALMMARELGNVKQIRAIIASAKTHLDPL